MAARVDAQICAPSQKLHHAEFGRKNGGTAALGTLAKSVDTVDLKVRRRARLALQDRAAELLPGERVAACLRRPTGSAVAVHLCGGRAVVTGLQQCGSVWHCPICSRIISAARRDELNRLLKWGRAQGLAPVLLTLTGRHRRTDTLKHLMDGMKSAKKRLHQSRDWRAVADRIDGHVTATEITHGQHGWHVHFHVLLLVSVEHETAAIRLFDGLRTVWEHALERSGLDCNDHGFDVQGAARAGDYITKWGATEELTLSGEKVARNKGWTIWQLLDDASAQSSKLWCEYAHHFKGKRQLVWSRGLKSKAGITEKTDDDLVSEAERPDMEGGATEIGRMTSQQWRAVVRSNMRGQLLDFVEKEGRCGLEKILSSLRI